MTIYEINTAAWLAGRTLDEVSWDEIPEVDAVWLMGVWQRSPVGREISVETYPELRTEDVIGSPYCVRDYVVDERFGGPDALAHARSELARRGVKLILDYVPNHVAPDHPWVTEQPGLLHLRAGRRRSPTAATRTSRRGPTSCSSTRSRPSCARRSPSCWSGSPHSATACAATWRC